ncbi:ferredoxin reductase family protein [Gemella cuniculi]|uniref:ferredoxin reductase family protein n=1 Tax=Gemella cuniculi TaxID=150240 RepID=UPI000428B5FE|nr:ferredoxin reductase family protein [Gemella cuniculi]
MLKKYPKALYLTWVAILGLLPAPLALMLNMSLLESSNNLFIYDAGIYAYVWWLVIVYLSTRPSWLDRLIGLPAMYFVHGMVGVFALFAAFIHWYFSFSMHEEIKVTGNWALYLAAFLIVYSSLFMSGWFVDRFVPFAKIKNRLNKFLKHELSVWVHRLHFVAIFLIWLHVHVIPRIAILTPFMILFDLYTVYFLATYIWYKYIASHEDTTFTTIVANEKLSKTVQQLTLRLPKGHSYKAGDFYFLSFRDKNISKEKHPFSVASAPSKNPNEVVFTIQAVGDFTKNIPKVKVGSKVILEGPFGRFDAIAKENPKLPLILYGTGSGIAPLMSMAQEYKSEREVHIIWSAKNEDEMYFDDEFRELAVNENITYHGQAHRFTSDALKNILDKKEIITGLFFIVGAATTVLKVEKNLRKIGVKNTRIHDERLTM